MGYGQEVPLPPLILEQALPDALDSLALLSPLGLWSHSSAFCVPSSPASVGSSNMGHCWGLLLFPLLIGTEMEAAHSLIFSSLVLYRYFFIVQLAPCSMNCKSTATVHGTSVG